jgi:hypothetical protein
VFPGCAVKRYVERGGERERRQNREVENAGEWEGRGGRYNLTIKYSRNSTRTFLIRNSSLPNSVTMTR